jgi:hypothetical protein
LENRGLSKAFFSEEKNQKTFFTSCSDGSRQASDAALLDVSTRLSPSSTHSNQKFFASFF